MLSPQDRREISDLLGRFCIAADTRELSLLDDVLTSDVECVFQTGTAAGLDSVKAKMAAVLSRLTATQHNLTTSVVTEAPGGAAGTTYLVAQHVRAGADGGDTYAMGVTYRDRFVRTPAGWRIARRELAGSWRSGNPAVLTPPASGVDGHL
jgi:hypothetical protein